MGRMSIYKVCDRGRENKWKLKKEREIHGTILEGKAHREGQNTQVIEHNTAERRECGVSVVGSHINIII